MLYIRIKYDRASERASEREREQTVEGDKNDLPVYNVLFCLHSLSLNLVTYIIVLSFSDS